MEVAAAGDEYGTDGGNESKVLDCDTNGLELDEFGAPSLRFKRIGVSIDNIYLYIDTYNWQPVGQPRKRRPAPRASGSTLPKAYA